MLIANQVAMILSLPSAAVSVPPSHAQVERWVVNFADQQCIASASYGTAADPLYLALKPSPLGEVVQVSVIQRAGAGYDPEVLSAELQLDDGPPMAVSMLAVGGKKGNLSSFRINLPAADFVRFRQAKRMTLSSSPKVTHSFQLAQMPALTRAMDKCIADLRNHWNIEPMAQAKLRSRAKANKANFVGVFKSDDYPGVSLSNNETGTVGFALLIDERGKVADCTVTATSGRAALDAQACAILLVRARFTPAIGADGKPAKDAAHAMVKWELP